MHGYQVRPLHGKNAGTNPASPIPWDIGESARDVKMGFSSELANEQRTEFRVYWRLAGAVNSGAVRDDVRVLGWSTGKPSKNPHLTRFDISQNRHSSKIEADNQSHAAIYLHLPTLIAESVSST